MFARVLVAACLLGACVRSSSVMCEDGSICPPGYRCGEGNRCISDEQLAACAGLAEGATCTFGGIVGVCRDGACGYEFCGDGYLSGTESCDGDDLGTADCTDAGFYDAPGLACSPFCTFDVRACTGFCGDGTVDGTELCDGAPPTASCMELGFDAGPSACSTACGLSFESCARFGWKRELLGEVAGFAITGTAHDDEWVVGAGGAAAHFDGVLWKAVATGVTDDLIAASARGPDDVWAIGSSVVIRFDGVAWSTVTGPTATSYVDVWATSGGVYIATASSGVFVSDGMTWQAVGDLVGEPLAAIGGTSNTDVWAAGNDMLFHYNGSTWSPALAGHVTDLVAIAPDLVWVVGRTSSSFGSPGLIARWDGQSWVTFTIPNTNLIAIAASAPNDAWVSQASSALLHFDGTAWADGGVVSSATSSVVGLHGLGPGEVAGVTPDGFAFRYRGQFYAGLTQPGGNAPNRIHGAAGYDLLVADQRGSVHHFDGAAWVTRVVEANQVLRALWRSGDVAWTGSSSGRLYAFDGTTWNQMHAVTLGIDEIWGTPTDLWLTSGETVHQFDGAQWRDHGAPQPGAELSAGGGTGPNDAWVAATAGLGSTVLHWDGTTWSVAFDSPSRINAVLALAPDDVLATTVTGILRYDGSTWTFTDVSNVDSLDFIAASAPDDILVASRGELFHFDGSTWSPMRAPSSQFPLDIKGLSAANGRFDLLMSSPTQRRVFSLFRTRPWLCEAAETSCTNAVDDDCDGAIDGLDTECP